MAKEKDNAPSRRSLATLVALAFLAHAGALGAGFVFDDRGAIQENPVVQGALDLGALLGTDFWGQPPGSGPGTWRPLVVFSFWLNKHVVGGGFHETNLLLHVGAVLALAFALHRQTKKAAFAFVAALVFAVLGIHTEAIVGLVGRADVMAAGLSFLAWYLLGRPEEPLPLRRALLASLAFVGAILCKESAIAFPLLVVLGDLVLVPRFDPVKVAPVRYGPLVLAAAMTIGLRAACFGSLFSVQRDFQANPLLAEGLATRVFTSFELFGMAMRRIVVPVGLSADYSYAAVLPAKSPFSLGVVVGALLFVSIAYVGVRFSRKDRLLSLAAVLLLVPWLVVSHLVFRLPTIFAERLLYLPASGFALLVAWAVDRVLVPKNESKASNEKKRRPSQATTIGPTQLRNAAILLAPVLVVNVALAMQRAKVWKDDRSLFEAALAVVPGSARAQHNYGSALLNEGKAALSIPYFERASEILPSWSEPHAQLGVAWLDEQRPAEAEEHFRKAVALEPEAPKAVFNLAVFLLREGKLAEAKSLLTPFVQKFPARAREASLLRQVEARMHTEQLP